MFAVVRKRNGGSCRASERGKPSTTLLRLAKGGGGRWRSDQPQMSERWKEEKGIVASRESVFVRRKNLRAKTTTKRLTRNLLEKADI